MKIWMQIMMMWSIYDAGIGKAMGFLSMIQSAVIFWSQQKTYLNFKWTITINARFMQLADKCMSMVSQDKWVEQLQCNHCLQRILIQHIYLSIILIMGTIYVNAFKWKVIIFYSFFIYFIISMNNLEPSSTIKMSQNYILIICVLKVHRHHK